MKNKFIAMMSIIVKNRIFVAVYNIILFVAAVVLVCFGQMTSGYFGVFLMIGGLAILLILIYLYNKKYR